MTKRKNPATSGRFGKQAPGRKRGHPRPISVKVDEELLLHLSSEFPVSEIFCRGSSGKLLPARIDTVDLAKVLRVTTYWRARWDKSSRTYYVTGTPRGGKHGSKYVQLHRLITDAPAGLTVDHIDHDALNNRRSNILVVTQTINSWNRRNAKPNTKRKYQEFLDGRQR